MDSLPLIHPFTHTHTLMVADPAHLEQLGVSQGHFDMQTGGSGDQSVNFMINGRHTLPPEPQIFATTKCVTFTWLQVLIIEMTVS